MPGLSLDGTDAVSFYVDEKRPFQDLNVAQTSGAISRAMNTWDGVVCSDLGMYQVPSGKRITTGFISELFGFGGSFNYVADVVDAGWLGADFFDLLAPDGSTLARHGYRRTRTGEWKGRGQIKWAEFQNLSARPGVFRNPVFENARDYTSSGILLKLRDQTYPCMYGYYTPIFLLQAFCVYHAYRNNAEQRWYWLILFFPLIGCIIYFIHDFNAKSTLDSLKEHAKQTVISNYRIEQLEKALRFSDNLKNKLSLAEAYVEFSRYQDAVPLYVDCLKGFMARDPFIRMKLLYAHYLNGDHDAVVECGYELKSEKAFKGSEEKVAFAWSLFHTGKRDEAGRVFDEMDKSFTNYYHRLEYCKFLLQIGNPEPAKEKLTILLEEYEQMQATERRLEKNIFRETRELYAHHFQRA